MYEKVGNFNLKYRICADYDFMIRMMVDKSINLEYIDDYMVYMRVGGTSTCGLKGYIKNLKESHKVLIDNKVKHPYIVDIKRIMKTVYQMSVAKLKNK